MLDQPPDGWDVNDVRVQHQLGRAGAAGLERVSERALTTNRAGWFGHVRTNLVPVFAVVLVTGQVVAPRVAAVADADTTGRAAIEAAFAPAGDAPEPAPLTVEQLSAVVSRVTDEWLHVLPAVELSTVSVELADLPGLVLGATVGDGSTPKVLIDPTAAGHGWGSMDLPTVIRHELGHVLGLDHANDGLMEALLAPGETHAVESAASVAESVPAGPAEVVPAETVPAQVMAMPAESAPSDAPESASAADASEPVAPSAPTSLSGQTATEAAAGPPADDVAATQELSALQEQPSTEPTNDASTTGTATVAATDAASGSPGSSRWMVTDGVATASVDAGGTLEVTVRYDELTNSIELVEADGSVDSLPLEGITSVSVLGGAGDDTFTVDASTGASPVPVTVDGGAGTDTVVGPSAATRWHVTDAGRGSVVGVEFSNVSTLRGTAGHDDTFVISDRGFVAIVDGGSAGFDSLIIAGSHLSVVSTTLGPSDGRITLDEMTITYTGLEPVTISGPLVDFTFDAGGLDDAITLSQSGGMLTLSGPTFELTELPVPNGSLTINGGAGADHVTLSGAIALGGASLTIDAELIDVPAAASITTGSDVTLAAAAQNADVTQAASQFARVSVDGSITAGGSIVLTATVGQTLAVVGQTLTSGAGFVLGSDSRAEIRNGAVVSGATLFVRAETMVSFTYEGDAPPLTVFDVVNMPGGGSVNVEITNVTHAGISGGARATAGGGPLSGTDLDSVAVEAADDTSVVITITDTSTPSTAAALAAQIGNFLTFDRLAATTSVSRDTRAYVEDRPAIGDTLVTPGTVRVEAENT